MVNSSTGSAARGSSFLAQASPMPRFPLLTTGLALAAAVVASCGGGGALGPAAAANAGEFQVLGINVPQGGTWELNRPIRIELNHPVDPASIGLQSIRIEGTSAGSMGRPVTGGFALEPGSGGRIIVFQPSCPTSEELDDGGLLPGGHGYRVSVPAGGAYGSSALRDRGGHSLARGMSRDFLTPGTGQNLFHDPQPHPPRVVGIEWPQGLNLYTAPEPALRIRFDQPIDGRSSNLNLDRLQVRYSDQPASSGGVPGYSELLPGRVVLEENCAGTGAAVRFELSGLLPPDRLLRVEMRNTFRDIAGQSNATDWASTPHLTPLLSETYGGALLGWSDDQESIDEYRDGFLDSSGLDPAAALRVPAAAVRDGGLEATFEFTSGIPEDADLSLLQDAEIFTSGQVFLFSSTGRLFLVNNGVLRVDDFHLGAGVTLRGSGPNPLVIYIQGQATIDGILDVSGFDSYWPTSLNSPQFPEGPVLGACGGGQGGMSSRIPHDLTPRGDSGQSAFALADSGGVGGEGGMNQLQGTMGPQNLIAAGGGGGTFALTANESIIWDGWADHQRPRASDTRGPDHVWARHHYWPDGVHRGPAFRDSLLPIYGGEAGMRGTSYLAIDGLDPRNPPATAHGMYGMEDGTTDYVVPADDPQDFDPAWKAIDPPFDFGHPTEGPDPGGPGLSVFSNDGDTGDDFWGLRINDDGSATFGELLVPWAGSGGGASGDSFQVARKTDPITGRLLSVVDSLPTDTWPPAAGTHGYYRKGAPGGGGGGQLQLLAIGPIVMGPEAIVRGNGGIGHGGESTVSADHQLSGSGGGSGGHLVLHSATLLDLSQVDVGSAATAAEVEDLDFADSFTAIGGRRGWAASYATRVENTNVQDGNGDLMIGRGGAGGNGVIQIHVPDPGVDILWPAAAEPGIRDYIHHADPAGRPADPDRIEEVLRHFSRPQPYVLVPLFSSSSQAQSVWIDTGLAGLREPALGDGPFPDFADPALRFDGIDADGAVRTSGGKVEALPDLLQAPLSAAVFGAEQVRVSGAAAVFAGHEALLRAPEALVGYDLVPSLNRPTGTFEIVSASYDPAADELQLATLPADGAMTMATEPGQDWGLRPKFFRLDALGVKDSLPASAGVSIEFQGTDDPSDPGAVVPGPNQWTADLGVLKGLRLVRYRVTFEIDALGQGVGPGSPRPRLGYLKLPFTW